MRTQLDEPIEVGDVILIAKPRGGSGYAVIRDVLKRNCMVSYLAANGESWLREKTIASEVDLMFRLSNPEIKKIGLPI